MDMGTHTYGTYPDGDPVPDPNLPLPRREPGALVFPPPVKGSAAGWQDDSERNDSKVALVNDLTKQIDHMVGEFHRAPSPIHAFSTAVRIVALWERLREAQR